MTRPKERRQSTRATNKVYTSLNENALESIVEKANKQVSFDKL